MSVGLGLLYNEEDYTDMAETHQTKLSCGRDDQLLTNSELEQIAETNGQLALCVLYCVRVQSGCDS